MRYYIVDDKIGVIKTIENIIESQDIGDVIGFETNPAKAVNEIIMKRPDIVLVDLLMPEMDGIELVKRVSNENSDIAFVMLSKVTDKEMVAQAYDAGIEFFIHKPVNLREIIAVLRNVAEKKKINSMMNDIKGIFKNDNRKEELDGKFDASDDGANAISMFLGMLGMNGEKGTADIFFFIFHDHTL